MATGGDICLVLSGRVNFGWGGSIFRSDDITRYSVLYKTRLSVTCCFQDVFFSPQRLNKKALINKYLKLWAL